MNINQKLNTTNNFREENEKMKNLTNQDFKNIKGKLNYEHMANGKKHTSKMIKLLQNVMLTIYQLLKVNIHI